MMTHYSNFTTTDFSTDDHFINWVLDATPEADLQWQNWLAIHPEKASEVAEARLLVQSFYQSQQQAITSQIDKVWEAIQQSLIEKQQPTTISLKARLMPVLRIAAILFVVAGAIILSYGLYQRNQTISYATAYGETKKIDLPDGSSVMLNANSNLSFKKGWEKNENRDIILEGEAYFTVQHLKNNQPFVVHAANHIDIRVLGTEFNVINRHNDVQVVLNKGRVQLEQSQSGVTDTVMMRPGERVTAVNNKLQKTARQTVDTHVYTAWREQRMVFQNATIDELKTWLKDNYNIDLVLQDSSLANIRFNSEFSTDNWKILVKALETTYGITATFNENEVVLKAH